MKKLFSLTVLIGCLVLFASTSAVTAQNAVRNATNCDFIVKAAYGLPGTCTIVGYTPIATVPAGTQVNLPIPPGMVIIVAKGEYSSPFSGCAFYIGQMCSPYPPVDNVSCLASPCGNYTAELLPGFGIWLHY